MRLHPIRIFLLACLLASCSNIPAASPVTATQITIPTSTQTLIPAPISIPTEERILSTPTIDPLPTETGLDPADWMNWPVTPIVTQHVREIYELGQTLGN